MFYYIVVFDISKTGKTSTQIAEELLERSVRFSIISKFHMRAVTYLGITRQYIDETVTILEDYFTKNKL